MWKAIILRLGFLIFMISGIMMIAYFEGSRNEINKNRQLTSESMPEQADTSKNNQGRNDLEDIEFPKDFFFGTAYSDFQTAGLSPTSDWSKYWDEIAKNVAKNSLVKRKINLTPTPSGNANDLFHRYKEDFDLGGQIGIQVHRISLEWSRIEPEEGKWDYKALQKYKEIFLYMKNHGIEPMICLNHFPNPAWFTDLGGWENNKAPYYYKRYAEFLASNLGIPLKIKWWLTFNEPQFSIIVPYGDGMWPPFKPVKSFQDKDGFARLMHVASNILDGHRLAYRAIHTIMDDKMTKDNQIMVFDPETIPYSVQ